MSETKAPAALTQTLRTGKAPGMVHLQDESRPMVALCGWKMTELFPDGDPRIVDCVVCAALDEAFPLKAKP